MSAKDEQFLKRLAVTFRTEARELVQAIASGLVELENASTEEAKASNLEAIFRAAHSLKGAARSVNNIEVETVCQSVEHVFALLQRRELVASLGLFDRLHQAVTVLGQLLQSPEAGASSPAAPRMAEIVAALKTASAESGFIPENKSALEPPIIPKATAEARQDNPPEIPALGDTVRVSSAKLDALLLQAEELLAAKLAAHQRVTGLRQLQSRPAEWKKKWTKLQGEVRTLQQTLSRKENGSGQALPKGSLVRITEFLDWNREFIESLDIEFADLATASAQDQRSVGAMVDNLLDDMKKIVMLPFSTLLDVFPRFVRELSRDQGKDVELVVRGGEIEMDRRVLEEMKDPLIHLVRNCLDHGIEAPQNRLQQGKPSRGTLAISISPKDSSTVELTVADDGNGIDPAKVKAAALKSGILSPERSQALGAKEALPLIFQPGISTSPIITDISGRGLGLAIVKETVEKLKGKLSLETELGKGTTFRMDLPLTLARFRGVLVRVQEHYFVVPTGDVERVARVKTTEIKTVENRKTIVLNGRAIALVGLSETLELPQKKDRSDRPETMSVAVLRASGQCIAFSVDEVLGEQEVLVKTLGKQLTRVRNIAGATILGNGRVVPILHVPDLMAAAVRGSEAGFEAPGVETPAIAETEKRCVLVAEDSITSRSLLKNILENAGYQVETAVDGIDAFTKLRSAQFHAVVSDVDMPRMNGFGLTAKIRSDKKFAELPVILVTALDSRSDREHGIDVGASAYIVKSSFDQSNLLEVLRRLI